MSLSPATRTRIETLLRDNPVVLFMKGSPQAPQCGFSAAASGVLNELLPQYATINVLEDAEMREGIKAYGNWPTIPQLYVKGELVGGADIVQSMYNSGELQALFGLPLPDRTPPAITITDQAAQAIRSALADAEPGLALHLSIDARFQPQFHLAEPSDDALRSESNGIDVLFDLGSAQRARGIRIDWVETMQGAGLSIDNPNAPSTVKQLSVRELAQRLEANEAITIVDVRPPEERAIAALKTPFRTLDAGIAALADLPKDAPIAFLCRSGGRSQQAAEQFRAHGYTKVYNVTGGINAWAREIDPTIAEY
ncbi:Grx4 family monothiol glutaredoxin [Rudaea cellulosilytica]|uniref:Grx4 family monothiol glutaredoxin n=1 Tax=Rudaea cellulosilytica TaxID=540746 RepID=UPI0003808A30|nr:Grx4 family monothiol glutaredoxin [Rudaea cellulosilytica]